MVLRVAVQKLVMSLLALGLLLGGCASYQPRHTVFDESLTAPYRLDSGDKLRVSVFGQQELSNTYAVDSSGYVAMPLIGAVPARGLTTQELEASVAARLRTNYIRDPDVTVEVASYRPFFIMGEVKTAGQYPYVAGMTMQTAIAIAGGYSPRANKREVVVTRQFNGEVVHGVVPITYPLRPGDTLFVRERFF
ncbi:MAG TPA: polysaccharide biosynthesis/export family protein [Hyphomicrobiales bacterium]|nr:polysaccharide biosynthesis/export family protein [Hyphomicrobiales bacterium]